MKINKLILTLTTLIGITLSSNVIAQEYWYILKGNQPVIISNPISNQPVIPPEAPVVPSENGLCGNDMFQCDQGTLHTDANDYLGQWYCGNYIESNFDWLSGTHDTCSKALDTPVCGSTYQTCNVGQYSPETANTWFCGNDAYGNFTWSNVVNCTVSTMPQCGITPDTCSNGTYTGNLMLGGTYTWICSGTDAENNPHDAYCQE